MKELCLSEIMVQQWDLEAVLESQMWKNKI